MNRKTVGEWIPRRDHSYNQHHPYGGRKRIVYYSPNRKVFLSAGGDIYTFNLSIGNLIIAWESSWSRSN